MGRTEQTWSQSVPETATKGQAGYFWKMGWKQSLDLSLLTFSHKLGSLYREGLQEKLQAHGKGRKTVPLRESLVLAFLTSRYPTPRQFSKGRGSLQPLGMGIFSLAPTVSQPVSAPEGMGSCGATNSRGPLYTNV